MIKAIFMNKRKVIMLILLIFWLFIMSGTVFATILNLTQKASLTVVECENAYGGEQNVLVDGKYPLKDVEVTIYLIEKGIYSSDTKTANIWEEEIKNNTFTPEFSKTLITGVDGKAKFENLEHGRYLVVATDTPKNVTVKMESFLIDLPTTNANGTEYNYDVTVYPKNTTVYGDVTLTKTDKTNKTALPGVSFELQYKNDDGTYKKYDYTENLVTDSNGQIKINGLSVGEYRLIETATLDGYILDKSIHKDFTISNDNTSINLSETNEKPTVIKQIKTGANSYGKHYSTFETENAEWKIEADIPTSIEKLKTYKLTDTLPEGINILLDTIEINCTNGSNNKKLVKGTDYSVEQNGREITINFSTKSLKEYSKLVLTYSTLFNSNVRYGVAEENSVTLTYTNKINENGEPDENSTATTIVDENSKAEVHTGKIVILKTNKEGDFLKGAKFKISLSKEDAQKETYIKDSNGQDIIAESDENGYIIFTGLKYGLDVPANTGSTNYWITEIESPAYQENGQIKHYNLLASPVEVIVNSNSGIVTDSTVKVVNKKGFIIPLTGGKYAVFLSFIGIIFIVIAIILKKKQYRRA